MQLNITFRNLDASDSLKSYAREKVERVNRYLDRAGEAHVVLSLERHLHHADITVHSGRFVLRGRDKSSDMYASLDNAMDKIEKQLIRYKERLKQHHGRDRVHHRHEHLEQALRVNHAVLDYESEHSEADAEAPPPSAPAASPAAPVAPVASAAPPKVVKTNELLAHSLTVDDAVMQLNLLNDEFLVFTNAETRAVNVLYRRKEGGYGLIEAPRIESGGY